MNERDYLRLKRQFEDEYKQKLAALELIWQEISGGKKPPKESAENNGNGAERVNSAAAVEEFVRQWNGEPFSTKQVEAWITQVKGLAANRTTIIHKLRRMVNEGQLQLVTKGSGKRASVYAITSQAIPSPEPPPQRLDTEDEEKSQMATEAEIEELRSLLGARQVNPRAFRQDVMQYEFGVTYLKELTHEQIQALIQRFQPEPPPAEDIPF
ncbi:MAG: hypothetical protein U0805_12090 [Pirellulales bacterium]